MKTVKLCSLAFLLSLAGLVYAAGNTQAAAQSKDESKPSCCAAGAGCCAEGAACCKAGEGCCAGGVCPMRDAKAGNTQVAGHAAPAGAQQAASHGEQHKAHGQSGAAQACSMEDGGCCCCAHKAEGEKAHAAHTPEAVGYVAATGHNEQAHAGCCKMRKADGGTALAKDAEGCCASCAECCAANAACCTAKAAKQ